MDGKKAVLGFLLFALVLSVTACSHENAKQTGKSDTAGGEAGKAVVDSENIPNELEPVPDEYKEQRYNIFYLMHGGWSNETTWLGTPEQPSEFKNILDHAIADGKISPLIIVCPTYNNTSGEGSADYSLTLKLTDQYHQELAGDLIPAVESKYSTYAEDTTEGGLQKSRNHRGFGGFSMGSVATWHTSIPIMG